MHSKPNGCQETGCRHQFGFQRGLGTREVLLASERCLKINQDRYASFTPFDELRHHQFIEKLAKRRLDLTDIRIILNLYHDQKAAVRIEDTTAEEVEIQRGVCQEVYYHQSSSICTQRKGTQGTRSSGHGH